MVASFNPMHYLKHAWDATHSAWGKSCIVLFYVFIWVQIIWALELIIAPRYGWECFYEGQTEYAAAGFEMWMRALNIITVGFYLYADRGGIKVWNVAMVFVINGAWTWSMLSPSTHAGELEGAPADCDFAGALSVLWVLFWWSLLALLCSFLEQRSAPSGTAAETTPIV